MRFYNTLIPYKVLKHNGIQYSTCRDFDHVSRYRGLRQIVHSPKTQDRFVALETPNPFTSNENDIIYYEVPPVEEDRIDLIAEKHLGNPNYGWVISYFNNIPDGYSVASGSVVRIPRSITSLFNKGELLQNVSPVQLNLGSE